MHPSGRCEACKVRTIRLVHPMVTGEGRSSTVSLERKRDKGEIVLVPSQNRVNHFVPHQWRRQGD